jgi:hypothetical protein
MRLSSGQKIDPKDWDAKRERAKAKPGTYLDGINDILDRYTNAATAVEHDTIIVSYPPLAPAAMKAEIERRYAELAAEAAGLPAVPLPPPPAPPTFTQY